MTYYMKRWSMPGYHKRGLSFLSIPLVFAMLFFYSGCGKPKSTTPDTPQQQNENPPPGGSSSGNLAESIFPHTDDWANPKVHGDWVVKNGKSVCLKCHTTTQVSVEGPPACGSCHILFPHADNWVQKENHGASVLKNGKATCATQCHGTDFKGGLSKVSCNLCHSIFPHSANWKSPEEHGATAKGDGKVNCIGCHGDDFRGGSSGVSCYGCHPGHPNYPHTPQWVQPENHGAFVKTNGKEGCATQCHGTDFKGGLSGRACTDCHKTFPHPNGWNTFEGHGQYVISSLNKVTTDCQACHGTNLLGGSSGQSCYQCHTVYPHLPNWSQPANHGSAAIGIGKVSCNSSNCHGTDFNGSAQAPACFSCHADFPHTDPKWMVLENKRESQRDESFHGDRFIRKLKRGETAACTECHGVNYDRSVGGARCVTCHTTGITHKTVNNVAWNTGPGHGEFFSGQFRSTDSIATCFACHGIPADFNNTQTQMELGNISFCYTCHTAYPHLSAMDTHSVRRAWEPVITTTCGPRTVTNWGHTYYLLGVADVPATCGSGGSCHTQGYRSYRLNFPAGLICGESCHGAGTRVVPIPVDVCPPPPSSQLPGPPTVTLTTPTNGEQNVAVDVARITAKFNEPMDSSTIQTGTFIVRKVGDTNSLPGSVTCDQQQSQAWCQTATYSLATTLQYETQYEAKITTVAKDFGGTSLAAEYRWTFTTIARDTTPPTVVSTIPVNGAQNVPIPVSGSVVLTVQFSEPIFKEVIHQTPIQVRKSNNNNGPLMSGSASWVPANCQTNCQTMAYSFPSISSTRYTATVTTIVRDLQGNFMAAPYTWTFKTGH